MGFKFNFASYNITRQFAALAKSFFVPIILVWAVLVCLPVTVFGQNPTILNSGTNFSLPTGIKTLKVEAWGGGGSGGNNVGGGGGAGAYARSNISGPFPASYPYVIGSGGINSNGGISTFGSGPFLVSAGGGSFGTTSVGGAGGNTTVGNESATLGGSGANGVGGSSGGDGGNSPNGGTGGARGGNGAAGTEGNPPGGGGGGSGKSNLTRPNGGNGQIRISYIALTSATNTDAQTVCSGSPLSTITYNVPTGSIVSITNLTSSGVMFTYTSGTGIIAISGNPTASISYTVNVKTSYGVTLNTTGTITFSPRLAVTNMTNTACSGDAFTTTPINSTNGIVPSGTTYSWSAPAVTGGLTGGAAGSGASSISGTLTNPTNTSQTASYTVTPVTGTCTGATFTVTVTVSPRPAVTNMTNTVCTDAAFTTTPVNSTNGIVPSGTTYSWSAPAVTGGLTGATAGSGASSISGTLTNPTNTSQTATYTVTPVTETCTGATFTVTVTVDPITAITSQPNTATQVECFGDGFTAISVSAIGGGLTYQWHSNSTNSNLGGISIPEANSPTFTPPSNSQGSAYYYVIVTGNCVIQTSNVSGEFIVTQPTTTFTSHPSTSPQGLCLGASFSAISVSAIGEGTVTYQWYRNSNNLNSGGTLITGATNESFTPPSSPVGTTYYYAIAKSNCGTVPSNVSGTFTVNPLTAINTESLAAQTICFSNAFTPISINATGTGTLTYVWYINTANNNTTGTPISLATSSSYTPPSSSAGTNYYYVIVSSGCGPDQISNPSGAFTVTPTNTTTSPSTDPTLCINTPLTNITIATTGATGISNAGVAGANGLPAGVSSSWSGNTISISGTPSASGTFNYSIPLIGGCGPIIATGTITVTPNNTVGAASSTSTRCINTALIKITHATTGATGIGAVTGLPAGVTAIWAGNIITISGTPTASGTFNYSIPLTGGCNTPAVNATGTITVNPLATVGPTSVAFPSVCISSPNLAPFTQPTIGVTGIGTPTGLPPGITASFNALNGQISFSGTATTTGLYTYSIPLTGKCINGLNATGTIDVTPVYDISSVSSVSATSIGGAATVTFFGNPATMLNGTYQITYQIKQASGAFTTVGPVNATVVNGKGTFSTTPINSTVDTYTVQILTIKKSTDLCTVTLPTLPITYFGVCSAVFSANSTFYVPANVYSITIEVYGGGGGGNSSGGGGGGYTIRQNITVSPGESIAVFVGNGGGQGIDGEVSYVTRDSNIANQLGNSLILANGGKGGSAANAQGGVFDPRFSGSNGNPASGNNGGKGGGPLGGNGGPIGINGSSPGGGGGKRSGGKGVGGTGLIVISYSCPDADNTDCIKIIDDGSKSGTTIIEFTCNDTWDAPQGLFDFTVIVGSGGGGAGSGFGSGGGGSGALIKQFFSTSNPYGLPAGTSFPVTLGNGGNGATGVNSSGMNGNPSSFSGSIDGSSINIIVPGGGGGGSQSSIPGASGASGGGGGARPNPSGAGGEGGNSIPISYAGTGVTLYQGNLGGNGEHSGSQNSIAGGGGGGMIAWVSADRPNGKASGNGQGEGGNGGNGIGLNLGDSLRYYGGGGGGIGEYFNGTEKVGIGGSTGGVKLGGNGNLANPTANGEAGKDKTGSGGGAGYGQGGRGGNGIVYIYYFNYRILKVEYLYFKSNYNEENRSGKLTWATSKEWENSHFEIERSVNNTKEWEAIDEVAGAGYSDKEVRYDYSDMKLPVAGGNIFYRLKQYDFDGAFTYSATRSIKVEALPGTTLWRVFPNPTTGNPFNIKILDPSAYQDEPITLRIISTTGQFETIQVSEMQQMGDQVSDWFTTRASGIYTIEISWGNQREYHKVILRR